MTNTEWGKNDWKTMHGPNFILQKRPVLQILSKVLSKLNFVSRAANMVRISTEMKSASQEEALGPEQARASFQP